MKDHATTQAQHIIEQWRNSGCHPDALESLIAKELRAVSTPVLPIHLDHLAAVKVVSLLTFNELGRMWEVSEREIVANRLEDAFGRSSNDE